MRRAIGGLYVITDEAVSGGDFEARCGAVLRGGAQVIQYRNKSGERALRLAQASLLATYCRRSEVPLIINDDVDLAAEVGADGVHLGRDDMGIAQARRRLGERMMIGVSCYDRLERARRAQSAGADYAAFGSFFPSRTKPDAVRADLGLLRAAHRELAIPIVAIGGITAENGRALVEAGADALAVVSSVFLAEDPRAAAAALAGLFRS